MKRLRRYQIEENLYRQAEQERNEEEKRLIPSLGARRAREEADRKYQERIRMIQRQIDDQESHERERTKEKLRSMQKSTFFDEKDVFNEMFPSVGDENSNTRQRKPSSSVTGIHSTFGHILSSTDSIERGDRSFPLPNISDDLKEYTFAKFASTYFQGNATSNFSKKTLKQPLLGLRSERDQLVRLELRSFQLD